jgi:ABC-type uncharacterized transport system substrate-binding protein
MEPKRLGLLHELVPGVPLIGVLLNPNSPPAVRQLQELEQAARTNRPALARVESQQRRGVERKGNVLLFPRDTDICHEGPVQSRERLGGLLRYYHREAA